MAKLGASNQKLQKMVLELYRSSEAYSFLKGQITELRDDYELAGLPEYEEEKQNRRDQEEMEKQYYEDHPEEDCEYDENGDPQPRERNPIKRSLDKIYIVRDLEEKYDINYLTIRNRGGEFFRMTKYLYNGKKVQALRLEYDILIGIVVFDILGKETHTSINFLFRD